MITTLIESAFQTGYLSVESEALIRQMLATKGYGTQELQALRELFVAVETGQIRREAHKKLQMPSIELVRGGK